MLGLKGKKLLALLVGEIKRGRFKPRAPETFISCGEALDNLGIPRRGRAGQQLQREGLTDLNEWTRINPEIRRMRITVAAEEDIRACLAFAAEKERHAVSIRA
jgi:hypothetical protein